MTVSTNRAAGARRRPRSWCAFVRLATVVLALIASHASLADVVGEGDYAPRPEDPFDDPLIPLDGGDVDGDIIVGGTGLFPEQDLAPVGRLVIDVPAFTLPLTSNNAYIGFLPDGIGEALVSGFGSEWSVDDLFVVGVEGVGYLSVTTGARIRSALSVSSTNDDEPDTIIGQEFTSQGYVTVSGFGSQLINNVLTVGQMGFGRVEVSDRAQIVTRDQAFIGDEYNIGTNEIGTGHVIITGRGTRWTVGDVTDTTTQTTDELRVGVEGRGTLEVLNQGLVVVAQDVLIGDRTTSYGQVFVSGQDSLLWTYDRLFVGSTQTSGAGDLYVSDRAVARADQSTEISPNGLVQLATGGVILSPTITNNGIIRGDGRIQGNVTNNGSIRNAALLANIRERMFFTGTVVNNSDIESIGGEMEFDGLLTNSGLNADIVGKDAIFRFLGGFNNSGNVFLDNTVVWAPGTFQSSAALSLAAAESSIIGSLALTGSNTMFVDIGNEFSRLELTQNASLAGILSISLTDDYIPRIGDAFEFIQAGSVTGTFASVVAPGISGFDFNVSYTANSAIINVIAGFVFNADFDGDGTVTPADLEIWKMNVGTGTLPSQGDADGDGDVDGGDFLLWQQQLGTMPSSPAFAAVPEPATVSMLLGAAFALPLRRRARSRT